MAGRKLLNYSTEVNADKTVGEIQGVLARSGAKSVTVDYDDGTPVGVSFLIETAVGPRAFRLPANIEAAFEVMQRQYRAGRVQRRFVTREQAARVGWRIVKDWIEAQLAIIELGMVGLEEIFLPYLINEQGETLYQLMMARRLALPAPLE
jgi:hypothetical protein